MIADAALGVSTWNNDRRVKRAKSAVRSVRLRVGGLTLHAWASRPFPGLALPPRFAAFGAASGGDIRLTVSDAEVPEPAAGSLLFDSGGLWKVHRHAGGRLYVFAEPLPGRRPYKAVAIDEGLERGTVYVPRAPQAAKPGYVLGFPLDELLFQHRLPREGGFEVHASAAVIDGRAAVFCGVSGAGKTTISRLIARHTRGALVLSDDRVALRPRAGRFWAWGTPWHGSGRFALPDKAPLGAVFVLEQARVSRAERLAEGAPARLFARSFPPPWDPAGLLAVLEACGRLCARTPVFHLRFRRDRSAVDAVRDALEKA
jgi:hypothetical protein